MSKQPITVLQEELSDDRDRCGVDQKVGDSEATEESWG